MASRSRHPARRPARSRKRYSPGVGDPIDSARSYTSLLYSRKLHPDERLPPEALSVSGISGSASGGLLRGAQYGVASASPSPIGNQRFLTRRERATSVPTKRRSHPRRPATGWGWLRSEQSQVLERGLLAARLGSINRARQRNATAVGMRCRDREGASSETTTEARTSGSGGYWRRDSPILLENQQTSQRQGDRPGEPCGSERNLHHGPRWMTAAFGAWSIRPRGRPHGGRENLRSPRFAASFRPPRRTRSVRGRMGGTRASRAFRAAG